MEHRSNGVVQGSTRGTLVPLLWSLRPGDLLLPPRYHATDTGWMHLKL